jgi:hypothetical protein
MNTLSSLFGYGLDYVKELKLPTLSTFIPVWPFTKGEPFEDDNPDPAEEDTGAEDTGAEDTGEEDTGEENTGEKKVPKSSFFNTQDVNPVVMLIINIILFFLYYIFILILASIVANDLIYAHWGVRLFTFIFVVYLCYNTSTVVYPISIYYIVMALYNTYSNFRDKPLDPESLKQWHPKPLFPRRYAFLPIITSRGGGIIDLLNPFTYFPLGDNPREPKYANYEYDATQYKEDLNMLIPGFTGLKDQYFGTLLKKFTNYFSELNKPFIKFSEAELEAPIESSESKDMALKGIKEQIKGAIVTATGLEESAKYIAKSLKPT